jgi:hypothetical protein
MTETRDPAEGWRRRFVGLPEFEAVALAQEIGLVTRVVRRDATSYVATRDYRVERLNLVIEAGVVRSISLG